MRLFCILVLTASLLATNSSAEWLVIAPGMELGSFSAAKPSTVGDSKFTILRIDPVLWELVVVGASWKTELENQTAKQWCESNGFTAAINAGMFAQDYSSHIGFLGSKGHLNSNQVNSYMSVAAFGPKDSIGNPEFRIFDLDSPEVTMEAILNDYNSVVQNLRLIKRSGENRWTQQDKMWSEAALGEDSSGRILFMFSRSPFTMHDFNEELLGLGIGLVAAQHLEGGPEAQLFLQSGSLTQELFGSYETQFWENDNNAHAWPIPNVIGVRRRSTGG